MGVYIDMEMPQEGFVEILVRSDGTVQQTGQSYRIDETDYYTPYVGEMPVMYEAVPVPPHGDLIDRREAIIDANERAYDFWLSDDEVNATIQFLNEQTTIIPAEEGEP